MCILTFPSVDVADTRIFARLAGEGRQLLVYEMSYGAGGEGAMVLPLPVASRDEDAAVKFIDLSALPDFFACFNDLIWLYEETHSDGYTLSSDSEPVKPPLKVHEVGAFDASFVPSIADFTRLDERFRLPDDVWSQLPQYRDFGFAVFKLRDTGGGLKAAHPMAFEFSTRHSGVVYVPTVHVHDRQVHARAWFDHIVYLQGTRCSVGESALYFSAGRRLTRDWLMNTTDLKGRGEEGWKFKRLGDPEADRYGVIWPVGPSEKYREQRDWIAKLQERGVEPERWWDLAPHLDPAADLYAVGLSGSLRNADLRIGVA